MNEIYKVSLSPLEPYFLGNDKTFHYGGEDKKRIGKESYYISSEQLPSQTTLMGVLRYLGLRRKDSDYMLDPIDEENIGSDSFKFDYENQTFGRIEKISPLFMCDSMGNVYTRTPMDHVIYAKNLAGQKIAFKNYEPFRMDFKEIKTNYGVRIFPLKNEYDPKEGVSYSFMSITDGKIVGFDKLFSSVEKVGIDIEKQRTKNKDSFFKMKYVRMESDFEFAFYAEVKPGFFDIDDGKPVCEKFVYMGRRKSCFAVRLEKVDTFPSVALRTGGLDKKYKKVYLISDSVLDSKGIEVLNKIAMFGVSNVSVARQFVTNYGKTGQRGRFTKGKLYRMIQAGSVFIVKNEDLEMVEKLFRNEHYSKAGFNNIVIGGNE